MISEQQLLELQNQLQITITLEQLMASGFQLSDHIRAADIKPLITSGSPYVAYVSSGRRTSYRLKNADTDTYYLAVSTITTDDNYSELSETVFVEVLEEEVEVTP